MKKPKKITLRNLAASTAQQVFDYVVYHLRTQKVKSYSDRSGCLYRGPDNTACAAGCLMSNTEYNPGMEQSTWHSLVSYRKVPSVHERLITDLQIIHDKSDPSKWNGLFWRLAKRNNLAYTPVRKR